MAIIFALLAFLGWGTGDVFGGIVARKIGGYSSAIWSYIFSLFIASLYIPFALPQLSGFNLSTLIWLLVLVPVGGIPLMALYEGIKVGNASLVGTIASAYSALVVVFSMFIFGEIINTSQLLSILMIIVGLVLSSLNFKSIKLNQIITDKGIPYAVIAMISWATYFTFIRIPIGHIGWFWPIYFSWLVFPLELLYLRAIKIKFETPKGHILLLSIINSFILCLALFAYSFASSIGQISIVAPISGAYPVLFAVLAYFVFKDRLSKQQIIGVVVTLSGVIFLSLLA